MPHIEVLKSGHVDRHDSQFPTLVQLDDGDLVYGFNRAATGGTHCARSSDGGRTWDEPHNTGIQGQTMTPIWLGDDRFLILYNKRFGDQSIRMCLVRASGSSWTIAFEGMMFDGRASLDLTDDISSQEQIGLIQFGYPNGLRLDEETVPATHWCVEDGVCGVRWTRLRIDGF